MISHPLKNPQRGFTLMEILVVLVLVSLVSTLLMQGFGYVLRLRLHVSQQIKQQRILQLQESWFRALVAGLIINPPEEKAMFQGDQSQFQGQSINTLTTPPGIPQKFSLTLSAEQGIVALKYQAGDREQWSLGQWPGEQAVFSYLDAEGKWVSNWPPKLGAAATQLPLAIQLQITSDTNPITWIVNIPGEKKPKPNIEEFL